MSDETTILVSELQSKIDLLQKKNDEVSNQLSMNTRGADNLLMQLEAHRSVINDNMAIIINLKTHLVSLQNQLKQLQDKTKG